MRRRRVVSLAALVLAVVGSVPLGAGPAGANTFGAPPVYFADGADHWYCYPDVTDAGQRVQIQQAMEALDVRTDMYDQFAGSTCGTSTDVVWWENDLPAGVRGQMTCVQDFLGVCDQKRVEYDAVEILVQSGACGGDFANFTTNLVKTMRHELGHTAGLFHGTPPTLCVPGAGTGPDGQLDAMVSGWVPTNLVYSAWKDHHKGHIDVRY